MRTRAMRLTALARGTFRSTGSGFLDPVYSIPTNIDSARTMYGLRKLRAAYSGNCVNLRRESDAAVQAFGFTAKGNLDRKAIAAWAGGSLVRVVTWYDQSGNATDLAADFATSAPVLNLLGNGNMPAIMFDGTTNMYLGTSNIVASTLTVLACHNVQGTSGTVWDSSNGACRVDYVNSTTLRAVITSTQVHVTSTFGLHTTNWQWQADTIARVTVDGGSANNTTTSSGTVLLPHRVGGTSGDVSMVGGIMELVCIVALPTTDFNTNALAYYGQ